MNSNPNKNVHLIATLVAQHAQDAALEAVLRQLVSASRAEAGCLQYDLHRDSDDAQRFYIVEIWQSAEILELHRQTEHFLKFSREHGALLASVNVSYLTPVV